MDLLYSLSMYLAVCNCDQHYSVSFACVLLNHSVLNACLVSFVVAMMTYSFFEAMQIQKMTMQWIYNSIILAVLYYTMSEFLFTLYLILKNAEVVHSLVRVYWVRCVFYHTQVVRMITVYTYNGSKHKLCVCVWIEQHLTDSYIHTR